MAHVSRPCYNFDAEQMYHTAEEIMSFEDVLAFVRNECSALSCSTLIHIPIPFLQLPKHKYMYGYNTEAGDPGVLGLMFKLGGFYEVSI